MTAGELELNIDRVFADIFSWCVGACKSWGLSTISLQTMVQSLFPLTCRSVSIYLHDRVDRQLAKPHMMPTVLAPSSLHVAAGAAASGSGNGDDVDGKKKSLRQRLRR